MSYIYGRLGSQLLLLALCSVRRDSDAIGEVKQYWKDKGYTHLMALNFRLPKGKTIAELRGTRGR